MCLSKRLLLLFIILTLASCKVEQSATLERYTPTDINDRWTVSTLSKEGINTDKILSMMQAIEKGEYHGISSILIAKNGKLVFEAYPGKFKRDEIHTTRSAGKSITSALVGIAIDKGFIDSVHEPILPYFPEYQGSITHWDKRKNNITIKHLLTMTSGVKGNEDKMYPTNDWTKFYLDQPLQYSPGQHFSYATSGVVVLGNVITRASGLRIPEFANQYLFQPLGITQYKWPITNSRGNQGLAMTGGGLNLTPRDMLKFGQLYLNQGIWNGNRILSEAWIKESTQQHVVSDLYGEGYGYLWRIVERKYGQKKVKSIEAWGNGGQFIMVIPSLSLVTVFTGENYGKFPETEQPFELLERYILFALEV
ncbi:class C beta-lactamase-related serine hydrolase [Alteromonadaceae bacterium M269]|nr:class C beta-lactamase-related serine hydrolase [Alteromonadaceae bacterium M269]